MSWLASKYAFHIIVSYGVTALVLGALIWSSVAMNARAKRDLAELDRERGR